MPIEKDHLMPPRLNSWLRYQCQRCHGARYLRNEGPCFSCCGTGQGEGPSALLGLVVVLVVVHGALVHPHWAAGAAVPIPFLLAAIDMNVRPWALWVVWALLAACLTLVVWHAAGTAAVLILGT